MSEKIKEKETELQEKLELSDELKETFKELNESFPEIKSIEDLPKSVIENAIKSGKPLLDEYLRYRLLQEKAIKENVSAQKNAENSSVGSQLNKYFTISGMPIASGQYWNGVHGMAQGEAEKDEEGLQQMRTLAKNTAFLIKSIALGKEKFGLPEKEKRVGTNFIR